MLYLLHIGIILNKWEYCFFGSCWRQYLKAVFSRWRGRAAAGPAVAADCAVQPVFNRAAIGADHRQHRPASGFRDRGVGQRHPAAVHRVARCGAGAEPVAERHPDFPGRRADLSRWRAGRGHRRIAFATLGWATRSLATPRIHSGIDSEGPA